MMRIWGRVYQPVVPGRGESTDVYNPDSVARPYTWVAVTSDPVTGDNSSVYFLNLMQVLLLNRNEDPFYANWGIPGQQAQQQQIAPDVYVAQTQQQFAPFFATLSVRRLPGPTPSYEIKARTFAGAVLGPVVVI